METGVFLDNQKLKDALYAYVNVTKKTMAEAVNKTAKDIAMRAMSVEFTKEAKRTSIEQLGTTKNVDVFKKVKMADPIKGKSSYLRVKTGSKAKNFPNVGTFKLANWIMKNQGLPAIGHKKQGIPGRGFGGSQSAGTIGQIAKRLIAGRIRSIGYIRIGWSAAVQAFGGNLTRGDFGPKTIKRLGGAIPAKPTTDIAEATIFNRTGRYDIRYFPARKRIPAGVLKIATDGLRKAVADKTNDMILYVRRKMKENWDK